MNLHVLRDKGNVSEDQIAQKLGFFDTVGAPSARVMYQRLQEDWGLPDWVVYPDGVGKGSDKGKKHRVPNTEEMRERKAQPSRDAIEELPPAEDAIEELPSPEGAIELFDKGIEQLQYYLNTLPMLVQQRQGKRFVSSEWIEDDVEDYLDPRDYSEAEWKKICEVNDVDPDTVPMNLVKLVPPHLSPRGSGPRVYKNLKVLIGMYALIYGSVDRLLEVLYPWPQEKEKEKEKLRKKLYEKRVPKKDRSKDGYVTRLLIAAEQIAQTVQGVEVGGGKPPPEVSRHELWIKWNIIDPMYQQGHSDQEILDYLNEDFAGEGDEYSLSKVIYLRTLYTPKPSR
jgi:hypothetical protein